MSADSAGAPAAAAAAGDHARPPGFERFAQHHRRRAARDGAWCVEVKERVLHDGSVERSVKSWHDAAKNAPPRRRPRSSTKVQTNAKPADKAPTARQRRSALRSAANHREKWCRLWRTVRSVLLAVVRFRRAGLAHSLRAAASASPGSPGKRRLTAESLADENAPAADIASPPKPKRAAPSAPPTGLRQGFLLG